MKKTTIKRIRRFMAENNVRLVIAKDVDDGYNYGESLLMDNSFAPQWVHDSIRKLMSLPATTTVWADTEMKVGKEIYRRVRVVRTIRNGKVRKYYRRARNDEEAVLIPHEPKGGALIERIPEHELSYGEMKMLAENLFKSHDIPEEYF